MKRLALFLISIMFLTSGCVGFNFPNVFGWKPFSYLNKGTQFGRDQLANRHMIANSILSLKGKDPNEVLSLLGQPQEINVTEREVSQDWYFVYYKGYKAYLSRHNDPASFDRGEFVIRFYHDRVIDTIKLT